MGPTALVKDVSTSAGIGASRPPCTRVEPSPDALMIRLRPTEPYRVLDWAAKEHRRTGHCRLSVFRRKQPQSADRQPQRLAWSAIG